MITKSKKQTLRYFILWGLVVVIYVLVLILQKAYPFGSRSFLTYDAYTQYKNMFHMLFTWLSGEQQGTFLWNMGMGIDAYQEALYYCLSPFNVMVLAMGEKRLELSIVILIIVKSACIPVTALYFFRHTNKNRTDNGYPAWLTSFIQITCSLAYGLCGYVLAYGHNIMWLDGLIMLPLIAVSIERLSSGKRTWQYVALLAITIVCNFYFAFYICICALIYFILENRTSWSEFCKKSAIFAMASLIAAMLSGVVLVPAVYVVTNAVPSVRSISIPGTIQWGQIGEYISSFYSLKEIRCVELFCNNSFCGSLVILLLMLFVTSKAVDIKTRVKYIIAIGVLVLALNYLPLNYVFHGFTMTHGLGNRFAFILTFLLVTAAYMVIMNMDNLQLKNVVISIIITIAIFAVSILDNRDMSTPLGYVIFLMSSAFVVVMLIFWCRNSVKLVTVLTMMCVIWCAELGGNALFTMADKYEDELLADSIQLDKWSDDYDELQVDDVERKTAMISENYAPYTQTNWYSSMANGNAIRAFESMGLSHFDNVEYLYEGTTPLTTLMYNVRYVLSQDSGMYSGYSVENSNDVCNVYRADELAGMGFVLDDNIADWQAEDVALSNQNDFIRKGCGVEADAFTELDMSDWTVSYFNQDVLAEDVGYCRYRTTNVFVPMMKYEFDAESDMDLYTYSKDVRNHYIEVIVDGREVVSNASYSTEMVSHIGKVSKGQHVKITVGSETSSKTGNVGEKWLKVYSFNSEVFDDAKKVIQENTLNECRIEIGSFTGEVNADKDGILYIAYPYNDGFAIYMDGEKADKLRLGTGNMGVKISEGSHSIKIDYCTPGLFLGIIISIIGIILFAILLRLDKKGIPHV